jgi:hypothetical protein
MKERSSTICKARARRPLAPPLDSGLNRSLDGLRELGKVERAATKQDHQVLFVHARFYLVLQAVFSSSRRTKPAPNEPACAERNFGKSKLW